MDQEIKIAKWPSMMLWCACIGLVLQLCLIAIIFWFQAEVGVLCFFILSLLPTFFLFIGYFHCRIWFTHDYFIVGDILGRKKQYLYSDITGIQQGSSDTKYIFIGNRKIEISALGEGHFEFLNYAYKGYKEALGQSIPKQPYRTNDIFRGNIYNPGQYLFLYFIFICGAFFIGDIVFQQIWQDNVLDRADIVYMIVSIVIILSMIAFVILSILAARNPKKYPKLVRFFFTSDQIRK